MGIVKYETDEFGKKFNIHQAVKDGWGIEFTDKTSLIGVNLIDRNDIKHKCSIVDCDWFMGILMVHFKEGGYQALDHCIEQFKIDNPSPTNKQQ